MQRADRRAARSSWLTSLIIGLNEYLGDEWITFGTDVATKRACAQEVAERAARMSRDPYGVERKALAYLRAEYRQFRAFVHHAERREGSLYMALRVADHLILAKAHHEAFDQPIFKLKGHTIGIKVARFTLENDGNGDLNPVIAIDSFVRLEQGRQEGTPDVVPRPVHEHPGVERVLGVIRKQAGRLSSVLKHLKRDITKERLAPARAGGTEDTDVRGSDIDILDGLEATVNDLLSDPDLLHVEEPAKKEEDGGLSTVSAREHAFGEEKESSHLEESGKEADTGHSDALPAAEEAYFAKENTLEENEDREEKGGESDISSEIEDMEESEVLDLINASILSNITTPGSDEPGLESPIIPSRIDSHRDSSVHLRAAGEEHPKLDLWLGSENDSVAPLDTREIVEDLRRQTQGAALKFEKLSAYIKQAPK